MKGTEYKPSHANHSVNSVKNEAKKLDRQVLGSNDWRCMKCGVSSHETPMKRPGPQGNDTLCNSCGIEYMS